MHFEVRLSYSEQYWCAEMDILFLISQMDNVPELDVC